VYGVPLFWPLSARNVKLPPWISTGGRMEAVVLALALGGLLVYAGGGQALDAAGLARPAG
jgi:hypothetical protein